MKGYNKSLLKYIFFYLPVDTKLKTDYIGWRLGGGGVVLGTKIPATEYYFINAHNKSSLGGYPKATLFQRRAWTHRGPITCQWPLKKVPPFGRM